MLELAGAGNAPSPFSATARPNSVAGRPGLLVTMAILVPCCSAAGLFFLFVGAWPITLFMGLHILALLVAFHHVERHTDDFERLTLNGDRLIFDTHQPDHDQHLEFNGFWVQVDLQTTSVGGGTTLLLRSHGKEIPFGTLLSDAERLAVSQELGRRLAQLRH
jgi:uncharacterized membrane protein